MGRIKIHFMSCSIIYKGHKEHKVINSLLDWHWNQSYLWTLGLLSSLQYKRVTNKVMHNFHATHEMNYLIILQTLPVQSHVMAHWSSRRRKVFEIAQRFRQDFLKIWFNTFPTLSELKWLVGKSPRNRILKIFHRFYTTLH